MRRIALLILLIGLPACATGTPPADRIVYRSAEGSAPLPDAGPQHHPVRQPVRQISEEERIRWHRENAPPPPPPRVVYEQAPVEYVDYQPPSFIWWPALSWGFHYGYGHGHRRSRYGFSLGSGGYGHYGW